MTFIIFCLMLINFSNTYKVIEYYTAQIVKYEPCDNRKYVIQMKNTQFKVLDKGVIVLDGVWDVTEDIMDISMQSIKFTRCKSLVEKETCEYFTTFKVTDTCKELNEKGQMWSKIFQNIKPPFICPIKKAKYVLQNGTMDANALTKTPGFKGYYWEMRQKAYEGDKLLICQVLGFETKKVKRRVN